MTIIREITRIIVVTKSLSNCCDLIINAAKKIKAPNNRNCRFLFIVILFVFTKVTY